MISMDEAVVVLAITILVAAPWVTAVVLAVKDISRNPGLFTYVVAAVPAARARPAVRTMSPSRRIDAGVKQARSPKTI